jgi:WD40 repeat protein
METIQCISFNQGNTTFIAGTDRGFVMYRVNPLEKLSERDLGGGIGIATQLFETNFIGLVGGGDNPLYPVNQFVLWNDYTAPSGSAIATIVEKDKIVAVRLNHDVVAVVTRKAAMLYSLQDMKPIREKIKTAPNPDGVCDLSSTTGTVFLCPGIEVGTVNIVDYKNKTERIVSCCSHPLRSITLNTSPDLSGSSSSVDSMTSVLKATLVQPPDSLFATTSQEGTLIRVFDVATQTKLRELRRGTDSCEIYSVRFSPDSRCLTITSSKNTAHVFSLTKDFENQSSRAGWLGGYFGSEWSSFPIEFAPMSTLAPQPGGPQFQPRVGPVRHISCVFPTSTTDAFRLVIAAHDGSYAVHDLQFKDHKSIPRTSGMFHTTGFTSTPASVLPNIK